MKTAFLTMDVESFYDTSCVKERGVTGSRSCAEQVGEFLDLLHTYGAKATLFVTADFLGECKPYLRRAAAEGHEIALHALVHESPVGYSRKQFKDCILRAREEIESELGTKVAGYRAPCFGIDEGKIEVLKELGFLYDSSALNFSAAYRSGKLNLKGYRKINDCLYCDGSFFEVKPSTLSGGGYVRLAPWTLVKGRLKRYFKRADAYVFYVHPFELYGGELPEAKTLPAVFRTFVNRGRKDYREKTELIFSWLKAEGYAFPTVSGYLGEAGDEGRR